MADEVPQWCPPVEVIDALELLRSGTLPAEVVLAVADGPTQDVEIVDPEGVPLARASASTADDGARVVSQVAAWLRHRSGRPFERLHRSPAELAGAAPTVLVDPWSDVDAVAELAVSMPGLRVVLVGSVAADGSGAVTRAIRALESALAAQDAELLVAAAGAARPEVMAAVGNAYAHGGEVMSLLGRAPAEREARGVVLMLTGLSGSGKSTIARAVRDHVVETSDQGVTLLDGDEVRRHLSAGLTFSAADRETNVRRIGWVAAEIAHHGGLVICSPIAPFAGTRAEVRRLVEGRGSRFVLVHVSTPLEECERRDRKGLYARARAGLIPEFTGISSPYEEPVDADLVIDTTDVSVAEARNRVWDLLTHASPVR